MASLHPGILLTLLASVTYAYRHYGYLVDFKASTTEFKPGITETLTLLCQLDDVTPTGQDLIGPRGVTYSFNPAEDIDYVAAVFIFRDNGTQTSSVARVLRRLQTPGDQNPAPELQTSTTEQVDVTGSLLRRGVGGYLQVVFKQPTNSTSGEYFCGFTAQTKQPQAVYSGKRVTIETVNATTRDLMTYINKVERQQNQEIRELEQEGHTLRYKFHTTVDPFKLKQTGVFHCSGRELDNSSSPTRLVYRTMAFPRPFRHAPTVFVSVAAVKGQGRRDDTFHDVEVTKVNATHLTVRCTALGHSQVNKLLVNWLSLGTYH